MSTRSAQLAQAGTIRNLLMLFGAVFFILGSASAVRAAEVIVDDGDAGYSDTGWSLATDQGYPLDPGMDVHYFAAGDGSQTATWTPDILITDSYQVYVSWTTHPNRATNAPYAINHAGGSNSFTVNQEQLADQVTTGGSGEWSGWYLAGTFIFNAGNPYSIVLNNNADEYVIADAVRLVSLTPTSTDISGMKFEDLNGNGVKDVNEPGLPGWSIVAAEGHDSFPVDSSSNSAISSDPLLAGQSYLVRVTGTYDAGDSITADAKYSVRSPNTYWTDHVQNYTSYGPELLDLQIDGLSPSWGPYNADHTYWLNVVGTGSGLNFMANDIAPGNNVGSFAVDIFHVVQATTTKDDGTYLLEDVLSTDFIVAEVPQAGWLQTAPTPDGYFAVNVQGTYADYDFGNQKAPSISGVKFDDLNGDGIKDPTEPGIPGWRIRLRDLTTDVVTPVDTDADGAYAYQDLPPGSYRVSEKQETGWTQTAPVSPSTYTVTLAQGQQEINKDFGNFKHFEVSGIKYEDVDGSGSYDAGEPLLANWEIVLTTPTSTVSTFTDVNGAYVFTDLEPGTYTLSEVNPDSSVWAQSEPGATGVYVIEGESGASFTDTNFGNYRHVAISGKKYQDNNFNGTREAGDPFLGNWTIELLSLRDGSKKTTVTKLTNPNKGLYSFTNLRPGTYFVREIMQKGWMPISPRSTYHRIEVVSGDTITGLNFGNNTMRNYAVWLILNPNSSFLQPLASEMALPTDLPAPGQTQGQSSGTEGQSAVPTPPVSLPPVLPVTPPPAPAQPPIQQFVSNLFSRILRLP